MEPMFWIWLGIIVATFILEFLTLELISIWFAFGAIVPFILSAIGGVSIELQIIIFIVVSGVLIVFLRRYAQKFLFKNTDFKTNLSSLEGKVFRLLEDTNFEKNGSIKINDVTWTAVSVNGELLKAGELVEIVKVEGNKFIVKKSNQQDDSKSQNMSSVENNEKKEEINQDSIKLEEGEK